MSASAQPPRRTSAELAAALGQILQRERLARNLDLADIAAGADVDPADVEAIESGDVTVDFVEFDAYARIGLGLGLSTLVAEAEALVRDPDASNAAAAADMPGSVHVPLGPPQPQLSFALIPRRLRGTILVLAIRDPGGVTDQVETSIVAEGNEEQIRDLGSACQNTADWLHAHSRS